MTDIVEMDVSSEHIQASRGKLLDFVNDGSTSTVQRVKLSRKHSDRPMLNEALFFRTLGCFPLVKLELFVGRMAEMPCQHLATTIERTRGSLKELKLKNMTLTGDADCLIRSLRDHPCLSAVFFARLHFEMGDPHESLIHSIGTCPRLRIVSVNLDDEVVKSLGPALSGLCSKPSLKQMYLGQTDEISHLKHVCQELHKNTTLREIYFEIGKPGDATSASADMSLQCIAKMLENNTSLEFLMLAAKGKVLLSGHGPITTALKSYNRTIRELRLYDIVADNSSAADC